MSIGRRLELDFNIAPKSLPAKKEAIKVSLWPLKVGAA